MNFADLESMARDYQNTEATKTHQRVTEKIDPEEFTRIHDSRYKEVIERTDMVRMLDVIRREVWGEGEIKPVFQDRDQDRYTRALIGGYSLSADGINGVAAERVTNNSALIFSCPIPQELNLSVHLAESVADYVI